MHLNLLIGTLIGFSIVFLINGISTGEFDLVLWIMWLIGGSLGHLLVAYLNKKTSKY